MTAVDRSQETATPTPTKQKGRTDRWLRKRVVQIVLVVVALMWLVRGSGCWQQVSGRSRSSQRRAGGPSSPDRPSSPSRITRASSATPISSRACGTHWRSPSLRPSSLCYWLQWRDTHWRGSLSRARRRVLIIVGLLVVPLQMALIPAFQIFNFFGLTGIPAVWVFHTAFGLRSLCS